MTNAPEVQVPTPRAAADDLDAWPTQSLAGKELAELTDEQTRIGVPSFQEGDVPPEASQTDVVLRPSQAMRVVVWRTADGVHVAPHGTTVSAITVDALLVALDPAADLAAWLKK